MKKWIIPLFILGTMFSVLFIQNQFSVEATIKKDELRVHRYYTLLQEEKWKEALELVHVDSKDASIDKKVEALQTSPASFTRYAIQQVDHLDGAHYYFIVHVTKEEDGIQNIYEDQVSVDEKTKKLSITSTDPNLALRSGEM